MGLARRLFRGETKFPLIQRRKRFYGVSIVLVVIAILSMLFQGFNLGVEFKGGEILQVPVSKGVDLAAARTFVDANGGKDAIVQTVGSSNGGTKLRVETGPLSEADSQRLLTALASHYRVSTDNIPSQTVGAAWGSQVTKKALEGLVLFLIAVIIYISIRFEPKMAAAAIIALIHDLILAAGIYSVTQFVVTPSTVIALLTVLGYSLYDTIVVFDKVEENTKGLERSSTSTYSEAAELAVNQTFMRSINTSLIALLPVSGLLFVGAFLLGAGTLKDLALALFVGLASGAYSSLFLATPLLADLKEREPTFQALHSRVLDRRAGGRGSRLAAPRTLPSTAVTAAAGAGGAQGGPATGAVAVADVPGVEPGAEPDAGADPMPSRAPVRRTGSAKAKPKKGIRPTRPAGKRKR